VTKLFAMDAGPLDYTETIAEWNRFREACAKTTHEGWPRSNPARL